MLDALVFLPIHSIKEGMDYIKPVSLPDARDLVEYFDSVYVICPLRRIVNYANVILFRQLSSKFLLPTWNVHQTSLSSNSWTNIVYEELWLA